MGGVAYWSVVSSKGQTQLWVKSLRHPLLTAVMDRRPAVLKNFQIVTLCGLLDNGIELRRLQCRCWQNILNCDVSRATETATASRLCNREYGGCKILNVGACFVCSGPSSGREVTAINVVTKQIGP